VTMITLAKRQEREWFKMKQRSAPLVLG
jgi:hypothetical protein